MEMHLKGNNYVNKIFCYFYACLIDSNTFTFYKLCKLIALVGLEILLQNGKFSFDVFDGH